MNCAIDQLCAQVAGVELDLVAGIESRGFLFSTSCNTTWHWIDDDQKAPANYPETWSMKVTILNMEARN